MKQCPRCKTVLAKSHSQKLVCRACGFITRNLQVVRDNQQFQQHYNYSKKISHIRITEQPIRQGAQKCTFKMRRRVEKPLFMSFQNILREAAINLSKSQREHKNIEFHTRQIWLAYCNLVSRNGVDVAGMFRKLLKGKSKQNPDKKQMEEKNQEEQQNQPKNQQQKKQNEAQNFPLNLNEGQTKKKRKGRPKKKGLTECLSTNQQKRIPIVLQVRRKYKELQSQTFQDLSLSERRYLFFKFIYSSIGSQEEFDASTIEYISQKYAMFLVKEIYEGYDGVFGIAEVKGRPLKMANKQLQGIMKMRKLNITDRSQIILVLLLEDLLREWSIERSIETEHTLENLLLLYTSSQNMHTMPLISSTIEQLKRVMSKQQKKERDQNKDYPQLSFTLVYAILYLAALMNSSALTIDDIVFRVGRAGLWFDFKGERHISEQKVCNSKIRKTVRILVKLLQIRCNLSFPSLSKWVEKYISACGLERYGKNILKLAEVLLKADQATKNQQRNMETTKTKLQFLDQDIIAKAIITIYIKLEIGFRSYPFLSTAPLQILQKFKLSQNLKQKNKDKFKSFLESYLHNFYSSGINLTKIVDNLEQKYGEGSKRALQLKPKFSIDNYSSIQYLTLKQLSQLAQVNASKNFSFSANLAGNNKRQPMHRGIKIDKQMSQQPILRLSQPFRKQLQMAIDEEAENSFQPEDLDLPSSNYQFFYQYMSNIKYAGRDLFVMFCQSLAAGECQMKDFYFWLEKMEKVLIDFQN